MMRLRVGPHVYELSEAEEAEVLALTDAALTAAIMGDRKPDPEREALGDEWQRWRKAEPEAMAERLERAGQAIVEEVVKANGLDVAPEEMPRFKLRRQP